MDVRLDLTNGVSFGGELLITADIASAGEIDLYFHSAGTEKPVPFKMAVALTMVDASGAIVSTDGITIGYDANEGNGVVSLVGTFTEGATLYIVAQRSNPVEVVA